MVWFGMACCGLVEIMKLHVGSGRLYVGSERLSGWMGLKSGGWIGQMGGQVRWVGTGYVRWLVSSSGSGKKVR